MNFVRVLDPFPFFRLAIPLVAGIFLSYACPTFSLQVEEYLGVGVGLLLGMLCTFRLRDYRHRWLFGCCFYVLLFLLGHGLFQYHEQNVKMIWEEEAKVYQGVVREIEIKQKSVRCRTNTVNKDIYLYLSKDSLSQNLRIGDEILFYTQIKNNQNPGIPYEFDYASYLYHQGISGTAFVFSDCWKSTGRRHSLSWKQRALAFRKRILEYYARWGLDTQVEAVLSALTVGYKNALPQEIKEQYAGAGISHVLALSGLHVGILWGLLSFLLTPLNSIRGGRIFRWLMMNLLLWGYAFVAGLSASIVRAVIMCLCVDLGRIRGSKSSSINLLAVAAFFMLLYNPCYLFDVGFQLSFLAVLSIVVCFRPLYLYIAPQHVISKFLVGTLGVSLVAQLGVAPLVVYYFSSFPTYFLLTNLVASPLVFVIMYLALMCLLCFFVPPLQTFLIYLLSHCIHGLNALTSWVSQLPGSSIEELYVSSFEVLLFYILLIIILCYLKTKRRFYVLSGLIVMAVVSSVFCYHAYPRPIQPSIWFYQLRNCSGIHLINPDRTSYLLTSDSTLQSFQYLQDSYWKREKFATPSVLVDSVVNSTEIWMKQGIVRWRGKTICIIKDNVWLKKTASNPLKVDYLYITKGYTGTLKPLLSLFDCQTVITDGLLSTYRRKKIEDECFQEHIKLVDIDKKGSLQILVEIKN